MKKQSSMLSEAELFPKSKYDANLFENAGSPLKESEVNSEELVLKMQEQDLANRNRDKIERFFKDKPQDFLINLIPKLKNMNLFENDILFSQGD